MRSVRLGGLGPVLALFVPLVAGLPAAGCGGGSEVTLSIPWQAGELSVFELSQRGQVIGSTSTRVDLRDGRWVLVSRVDVATGYEQSTVLAHAETLVPERTEFEAETAQGRVTYTAVYAGDKVTIEARRPDVEQRATVRLPAPPYHDNEQFILLLRALPLKEGWKGSVNLIVTRSASKIQLAVAVVGRETVTTPAGDFDAWKVELRGANQFGWVEVAPPHRLVKYENVGAQTVTLLKEYRPGR